MLRRKTFFIKFNLRRQKFSIKFHFYIHEEPPTLMPLTFGRDVLDEGEFAQLVCIVSKGDEPLTISWALKGDVISSEPSLTTASLGTRTSMLTIGSVGYRHSGTYTCTAKNDAGVTSEPATLKVNGNSSKLYPKKRKENRSLKFSQTLFFTVFWYL